MSTLFAIAFQIIAPGSADKPAPLPLATLHPFTDKYYRCAEHPHDELSELGDALGQDCAIAETKTGFTGDGSRNEDYDSWNELLLAPIGGIVTRIRVNPVANVPGTLGKPPASTITFERYDGLKIVYAHVQEIEVKVGEPVVPGQPVARIGNNGMSRSPHLHVGAWLGDQPYQIRWDLRALGALRRAAKAAAQGK